jgi:hypothetical protein
MKLSQFIKQLDESQVSRSKFVNVITLMLGRVAMCLAHAEKTLPSNMQGDGKKWVEHIIYTIRDFSNKFVAKKGDVEIDEYIRNNYESFVKFIHNMDQGIKYFMPHENDTQFKMANQWVEKIKKELGI